MRKPRYPAPLDWPPKSWQYGRWIGHCQPPLEWCKHQPWCSSMNTCHRYACWSRVGRWPESLHCRRQIHLVRLKRVRQHWIRWRWTPRIERVRLWVLRIWWIAVECAIRHCHCLCRAVRGIDLWQCPRRGSHRFSMVQQRTLAQIRNRDAGMWSSVCWPMSNELVLVATIQNKRGNSRQ